MNLKFYLFALSCFILLTSCKKSNDKNHLINQIEMDNTNSSNHENDYTNLELPSEKNSDYTGIKIINKKKEIRESDGNFNQMTLFEIEKNISIKQLKEYCSSVKSDYSDGYFQILVFFKNPNTQNFLIIQLQLYIMKMLI